MPAEAPDDIQDSTLAFSILVNGTAIKDFYPVVSVNIFHEINKISHAEIILIDGNEMGDFPISDSDDLVPGNTIGITAGYGSSGETSIFKGVIVKQAIEINPSGYNLVVTCKHNAVAMTFNRSEEEFKDKTDSSIMQSLLSGYGLDATVDSSSTVNENLFQKLATDWDLLLCRAEFCGYLIFLDGDQVVIGKPTFSGQASLRIAFGDSLLSFSAELNAEKQAPSVAATAWDSKTQALLKTTATEPTLNGQGNINGKKLSGSLQQKTLNLNSAAPLTQEELKTWADSSLLRMRLSGLRGQASFLGNATIKTGGLIELAGIGDRYNGNAYVSAVRHTLEEGRWTTLVKFGLANSPVSEKMNLSYGAATGQIPAIQGLQIGTVQKLSGDPESRFRILVNTPTNAQNQEGLWARMSNFYATSGAGSGFLPEVGDEVILGFPDNDPRYPIVLGSLYSNAKQPVNTPEDDNNYIKTLTTKSQLKISFDDEKKIMKFQTPAGNMITLSEDAKSIEITDQNSNSIKMTDSGINIESGKDITIKATGSITLDATKKCSITAQSDDVAVSGMNIKNSAQVGFTAKGNATAELSASGQTVVKGAIVMIN